jgi:hypothetical protein
MINYGYDMIPFTTQSYKKHLNVKHNNKKKCLDIFFTFLNTMIQAKTYQSAIFSFS